MKKFSILSVLALALLAFSASAQTNTVAATNATTTVPEFFTQAWDTMMGQGLTNLSVTTYGTYTPSVKEWGGGVVVSRNIPLGHGIGTGIGVGLDYYERNFYAVNGQVSLEADLTPFSGFGSWGSNIVVTPFTFVGLGTPFGSASTANGNLEALAATGAALHVAKIIGADFSVLGIYGSRTGIDAASGVFYGGGLDLTWKF